MANGIINRNKKGLILPFGQAFDLAKDPFLQLLKQFFLVPRAFREKVAQCRSMIRVKIPEHPLVVKVSTR
ncbi:hypothetical protein B4113_2100 [Geobacillus sp. B4113_201601]|nr:hypothetical protein B4113_2100 [Geobacillus sp. B4113_201601]